MAKQEEADQAQDLWRRAVLGQCRGHAASISSIGLVSFRLPNALRRCSAAILVNGGAVRNFTNIINGLGRAEGIWFAMGGTGALIQALADLMHEVGITVELEAPVERLIIENGAARGAVRGARRSARTSLLLHAGLELLGA